MAWLSVGTVFLVGAAFLYATFSLALNAHHRYTVGPIDFLAAAEKVKDYWLDVPSFFIGVSIGVLAWIAICVYFDIEKPKKDD